MPASAQLVRQWKLLRLPEASRTGFTIQESVDTSEVSGKTIRRVLKVLQKDFGITQRATRGIKRCHMPPLSVRLAAAIHAVYHAQPHSVDSIVGSPPIAPEFASRGREMVDHADLSEETVLWRSMTLRKYGAEKGVLPRKPGWPVLLRTDCPPPGRAEQSVSAFYGHDPSITWRIVPNS